MFEDAEDISAAPLKLKGCKEHCPNLCTDNKKWKYWDAVFQEIKSDLTLQINCYPGKKSE